MPDPKPDQTLMALLASETDDSSAEAGGGMPTFEQRIDMYLRAVYGPDAALTADMRAAAREHLLGAMAADLAEETTIPTPTPGRPSVPTIRSVAAENVRPSSDAVSRASASLANLWQRLASIVAEAFSMRALRMAAVPLLALIVVGSVFTSDWLSNHGGGSTTDLPANDDSGQGSRTRSLTPQGQPGQTAQTASEQKLERIIADEEAALGPNDPEVANRLLDLAILYHADGRYGDAEALCKRALAIQQHALGPKDPAIARTMKELASIYRAQGRNTEADEMQTKAEQP